MVKGFQELEIRFSVRNTSPFSQRQSQLCIRSRPTEHEQCVIKIFLSVFFVTRLLALFFLINSKPVKNVFVFEFTLRTIDYA